MFFNYSRHKLYIYFRDVEELLMQHAQFATLVKKMGGSKGLLSTMGKAAKSGGSGMKPSDAAKMQAGLKGLSSMLPPGMMEQMGGMGGIQNMMAQMGGMGGIQNMMAQMGLGGGGGGGGGGLASMLGALGGGGGGAGAAGLEGLLGGLGGGGPGAGRGGVRRPRKK